VARPSFPYLAPDFKRRFRAQAEVALGAAAFPRVLLQHRGIALLTFVMIPVAELARMKPVHTH